MQLPADGHRDTNSGAGLCTSGCAERAGVGRWGSVCNFCVVSVSGAVAGPAFPPRSPRDLGTRSFAFHGLFSFL